MVASPLPPVVRAAYGALEVRPGAPLPEVKSAYRAVLRRHHPDTGADDPDAAERIARARAAYRTIVMRAERSDALAAYLAATVTPPRPVLDVYG